MINASEYRLNNWVYRVHAPYGTEHARWYEQVKELKLGDNLSLPSSRVEPIRLTEELVKQCGFILEYKSDYTIKYTHSKNSEFGYDWNKSFDWRVRYYGEHFNHVKYLHQLQNLFYSLTGKELEITL